MLLPILVAIALSNCSSNRILESRLEPLYAPVAAGHIEYYRYGRGSPIILIAGFATDVSSWSSDFLKALSEKHQLIILNNRNVGGSIIHSQQYRSKDLAFDVHQLIQDLHLKKPAVLGISMGGMIAQQIAASYPKQVGHLILINTAISGPKAVHPSAEIQKKILNIPENKIGFYLVAIDSFFPASWRPEMAYKLAADRFLPNHLKAINLASIREKQHQFLIDWTQDTITAQKLRRLSLPVLILNGEKDTVIPPINSDVLAKTIPGAKLIRWQDGGHAIIYQYPKQLAERINYFIAARQAD